MNKKLISAFCGAALLTAAALPAYSVSAEDASVQIEVAVSNAGSIVLQYTPFSVTDRNGDGKCTIDEALYEVHDAYYDGGAAAGYASEQSDWGLSLKTLWGVTNGGSYGFYVNDTMSMGLGDELKDGDYLSAFVYADAEHYTDKYSYFNIRDAKVTPGETLEVTLNAVLFDDSWAPYSAPVKNARITIDGADSSFVTDENGKVSLTFDETGYYVISAKSSEIVLAAPALNVQVASAETTAIGDVTTTAYTAVTTTFAGTTPAADGVTTTTAAAGSTTTIAGAAATTTTTKASSNSNGSGTKTDSAKTGDTTSVAAITLAALLAGGTAFVFRRRNHE